MSVSMHMQLRTSPSLLQLARPLLGAPQPLFLLLFLSASVEVLDHNAHKPAYVTVSVTVHT